MKVKELITELKNHNPEKIVCTYHEGSVMEFFSNISIGKRDDKYVVIHSERTLDSRARGKYWGREDD